MDLNEKKEITVQTDRSRLMGKIMDVIGQSYP